MVVSRSLPYIAARFACWPTMAIVLGGESFCACILGGVPQPVSKAKAIENTAKFLLVVKRIHFQKCSKKQLCQT